MRTWWKDSLRERDAQWRARCRWFEAECERLEIECERLRPFEQVGYDEEPTDG